MLLIGSVVGTFAFVWLLRRPIQALPVVFYLLAACICVVGLYLTVAPQPSPLFRGFAAVVQKGHLAVALFALVMYAGAFAEGSRLRKAFMPIRAELSIVASILVCGHFLPYLRNYLTLIADPLALKPSVTASLAIACLLLLLLIPLATTSFNIIKRRMGIRAWRRLQLLAYPFFGLIYFHQLGYLLVPAAKGTPDAILSIAVYTLLFVGYIILRVLSVIRQDTATAVSPEQ
jgi:DMSO/TMAO reductase YedYZ heme-binding membrane subunit